MVLNPLRLLIQIFFCFSTHKRMQAIENVFAIGKKVEMGMCFCQPSGGFPNHTITELEKFSVYDKETCSVSSCSTLQGAFLFHEKSIILENSVSDFIIDLTFEFTS